MAVELIEPQKDVLRSGLNFTLALTRILVKDSVATRETATAKPNEDEESDLRMRVPVCGIVRKARSLSATL